MFRRSSLALGAVALFLAVGCGGSDSISVDRVAIGVQGRYEKRALGTGGYGSVTEAPTRYAYAQLRSASGVEDETDLDVNGQGTLYAPRGTSVYVTLVADVAVPASGGGLRLPDRQRPSAGARAGGARLAPPRRRPPPLPARP